MAKSTKNSEYGSFVLNDETRVNSHGFKVPNKEIDLVRFKENAVLLYMHRRGEVHGRWENIRIEGHLLLGDPVFDMDDPESAKIAGKVKRGFIKGASLHLNFTPTTTFVEALGQLELHGVEAWEGSIVDIPSNDKSLKLFLEGKELDDEAIKGYMLSAAPVNDSVKIKKSIKMEKVTLSALAISAFALAGITPGETPETISKAVEELGAKLKAEQTAHGLEKTQREVLEKQVKDQQSAALSAMVDQAITDGQIVAAQKETFIALGFESAKKVIEGLPKKVSLGAAAAPQNPTGAGEPKDLDEFEKMTLSAQLNFKNNNPAAYAKLFA